jgi:hypothetical protein
MRAFALSIALLAGCGASQREEFLAWNQARMWTVRTRASMDLSCPWDKVGITDLATDGTFARVVAAFGCGRRATYAWSFSVDAWIMESTTVSEPPALSGRR